MLEDDTVLICFVVIALLLIIIHLFSGKLWKLPCVCVCVPDGIHLTITTRFQPPHQEDKCYTRAAKFRRRPPVVIESLYGHEFLDNIPYVVILPMVFLVLLVMKILYLL